MDILEAHLAKTITLTDDQFDYFFSHFKPLSFKKGETIIKKGDRVNCEYFVLNGCLKTFYVNDDQKMFNFQFAMPTWWASDYNALYSGGKADFELDCITDTDVLCLSSEDRERLCREIYPLDTSFAGALIKAM